MPHYRVSVSRGFLPHWVCLVKVTAVRIGAMYQACAKLSTGGLCMHTGPWHRGVTPKRCYRVENNAVRAASPDPIKDKQNSKTLPFCLFSFFRFFVIYIFKKSPTLTFQRHFQSSSISPQFSNITAHRCRAIWVLDQPQRVESLWSAKNDRLLSSTVSWCWVSTAWILTVSPVPKTITSYSSSMLYHRLSRLASFLPWEMKGTKEK